MKIGYIDCSSGVSGDMFLGALVDAGVSFETLKDSLSLLSIQGFELKRSYVKRRGICGTKVDVLVDPGVQRKHTGLSEIRQIINSSPFTEKVKEGALSVFQNIGKAEAKVHGTNIEKVHFHEVGAVDSIVDIVGSVFGISLLGVDRIVASPINTGSGTVRCTHGVLPVPAPATVELLKGTPFFSSGVEKELATPTGVGLVTTLADSFGAIPMMTLKNSGYGAGEADLPTQANLLRILVGDESVSSSCEVVVVLETNVDDMNPQFYDTTMAALFEKGALDVFFTPIIMKKNRPSVKITVLCAQENEGVLSNILLLETTSFGVRSYKAERNILDREFEKVNTRYGSVTIKKGIIDGVVVKRMPEYEECRRISRENGQPLREVYDGIVHDGCSMTSRKPGTK